MKTWSQVWAFFPHFWKEYSHLSYDTFQSGDTQRVKKQMEHGGHRSSRGSRGVPGLQGGFNRVHCLVNISPLGVSWRKPSTAQRASGKNIKIRRHKFWCHPFFVPSFDWAYHVEGDQCLYIRFVVNLGVFQYFDCQGRLWFQSFKGFFVRIWMHT